MEKKIVYISGPFGAPTRWEVELNVMALKSTGLGLLKKGYVVIFPTWLGDLLPGEQLYDKERRAYWEDLIIGADIEIIKRCCDAIYMCRGWEGSTGAKRERDAAIAAGKEILYQND